MAYRPRGKAFVDPYNPTAFAICSRCGSLYNRDKLDWQYQWYGNKLFNKRIQVCGICMDKPSQFLRQVILPPDPAAINQPRSEPYAIDEAPTVASVNQNIAGANLSAVLGTTTPNQRTFTISFWVKCTEVLLDPSLFRVSLITNDTFLRVQRYSDTDIDLHNYVGGVSDQALWNDDAAGLPGYVPLNTWTHYVYAIDTTQPDIANRAKIYKNGAQHPTYVSKNLAHGTLFSNFMVSGATVLFPSTSNLVRMSGRMAFIQVLDGVQARAIDLGSQVAGLWKHKPYGGDFGPTGFYFSGDNGLQTKQGVGTAYTFTNSGVLLDYTDIPPYTSI
jgi:hypothetical protein